MPTGTGPKRSASAASLIAGEHLVDDEGRGSRAAARHGFAKKRTMRLKGRTTGARKGIDEKGTTSTLSTRSDFARTTGCESGCENRGQYADNRSAESAWLVVPHLSCGHLYRLSLVRPEQRRYCKTARRLRVLYRLRVKLPSVSWTSKNSVPPVCCPAPGTSTYLLEVFRRLA